MKDEDKVKQERLQTLKDLLENESEQVSEENESATEVDSKTHLNAMFEGEEITDAGKEKIATLFEAAVGYEVAKQSKEVEAKLHEEFEAAIESNKLEIQEEVDAYLSHVVEEWTTANEVKLQGKIKMDIFESFVTGMRDLFLEHNIEVPEGKDDLVEELMGRVEALEGDVKSLARKNVRLAEELSGRERELKFKEITEGMTMVQCEKIRELSESKTFDSIDQYEKTVQTIKESYFKSEVEEPILESVETVAEAVPESIKAYSDMIARQNKKK